jgi:hypothetical protein
MSDQEPQAEAQPPEPVAEGVDDFNIPLVDGENAAFMEVEPLRSDSM